MAKRSKRQFHCQKCGLPCTIYNKGKKHRVLVCPTCGVLATNPFVLGKSLKGAGRGALASIPIIGGAIAGATEGFVSDEKTSTATMPVVQSGTNRYTTEERVRDALRC